MRRTPLPLALALAGLLVPGLAACADDAAPEPRSAPPTTAAPAVDRGALVGVARQATLPREDVQALLDQLQVPGLTEARYGLDLWRVRYETVGVDGGRTVASGTVVVPVGAPGPRPVLSDQHGTQTERLAADAPPMEQEIIQAGIFFASQGYLVVGADYLGLGDHAAAHPYYHASTEASASLDLLRALRDAAPQLGTEVGDQLFLAGYSQGAHVTMALHRALEREAGHGYEVTASAPMAGAHDLAGVVLPLALEDPARSTPLYLAYLVVGLQEATGFAGDLSEVLRPPYDRLVPDLFDGGHGPEEIVPQLPADPAALLQPGFLAQLRAGEGPFVEALREQRVDDWAPRAPVRLLHGRADRDVPFRSSEVAAERMAALGADVELVDLGELDHAAASPLAYLAAKAWFDGFLPASLRSDTQ